MDCPFEANFLNSLQIDQAVWLSSPDVGSSKQQKSAFVCHDNVAQQTEKENKFRSRCHLDGDCETLSLLDVQTCINQYAVLSNQ